MLSLSSMRRPLTRAQALDWATSTLSSLGFDTTSWADGTIEKTLLYLMATGLADVSEVVKIVAEYGINALSSGVALKEYSLSRFANTQVAAVATVGPMTLTNVGSIPYTIAPGQLIASTATGVKFRNTTGGTISAGSVATPSTLSLTFTAQISGTTGNVALNAVNKLLTPLAGVTIANSSGTPWYTTEGADQESDASLRLRNSTKWSTLTVELVAESYEAIARAAGATKVKVHDSNPRGPGTIDVYCAADSDLLGASIMEAIQLAMSQRAFQTDSAWVTPWVDTDSRVAVKHPTDEPLDITAVLYHDPGTVGATILARANTALNDFLASLDIGGSDYSPGPSNVVLREDLIDVLKAVEGVRTVVMTAPSATTSVGALALVTEGTWTLSAVAVT
jgi:phage-related baseplate assembly protein